MQAWGLQREPSRTLGAKWDLGTLRLRGEVLKAYELKSNLLVSPLNNS